MRGGRTRLVVFAAILVGVSCLATAPSQAAPTANGREWRELYETTGPSWAQVAEVCPRDGVTPCTGTAAGKDLTGWVWATDTQVLDLMDDYVPELATTDPPMLSGPDHFLDGYYFLSVMRWTYYVSLTYSYTEWTGGWTASTSPDGTPIAGSASFHHPVFNGHIGLAPVPDEANPYRGVWLWRPAGLDYTPPVVTPAVAGTLGTNGWYVSDVDLTWDVHDLESPISSMTGCDPLAITADTASLTTTCSATSAPTAGTGSASVTVMRDTSAPLVTCAAKPVFELGELPASVSASVSDDLSGATAPVATVPVSTTTVGSFQVPVTGRDRAGTETTTQCKYRVVIPKCRGLAVTIVGTPGSDVINGTNGPDVIHGLRGGDTINGLDGKDVICGGVGPDVVYGGSGADTIDGGVSNDDLNGGSGDDVLFGGPDDDSLRGDAGHDRCRSGEIRMSSCESR